MSIIKSLANRVPLPVARTGLRAFSTASHQKTTFLLNWYANPYHTPLFVAKEKGWLKEEGLDLAIMEATNPSDVTEVVGSGQADMGLKAMIHILAAKDRGINLTSFGTLLDEPPTGLIFKKSTDIRQFTDIVGKRIGYIGHFGKVMIDDLARQAGLSPDSYETVRVGMNVTDAIIRGEVDTGIGFTNFQRIELEELTGEEAGMLRIDELDGLGCCCFCSVMYVANDEWARQNPEKLSALLRGVRRGVDFTTEYPEEAWEVMTRANPRLNTTMYSKIYARTLPYFSRDLLNVERDWQKVGQFCKHLGVLPNDFDQHTVWTNEHVPAMGKPSVEPVTPGGVLGIAKELVGGARSSAPEAATA
uniref:Thiamine pyrimidine synthase n=1 Tax=Chromera velia CCMP2878 TaxID=1169474 RepID=A0A0G4HXY6_9ALVE|mmetsp:Transcript_13920/g.27796  ORF Transcript_13920/g.27796 Transcript_13920/m.27796 type:complete len:360 (+) Transcript_13920:271-1350(+)|eukprot:Cvel_9372.t1-p1 / transcript=Cvel_9372.t1 / gene=Cvel_9372 / organism=Chromera_velia_CCMP2878 / gene_product=Pyrimidine precursor biosynthesis enzyme THI12, putative / transcript_product=Pyrimidine precursor biosynthesis enzyme THI12, putative / location=Cvel_scaffold538:25879-28339(+) / protein_length=359 / sequence_SO=supercontig / SO=protein_coding / is_pseudo=false